MPVVTLITLLATRGRVTTRDPIADGASSPQMKAMTGSRAGWTHIPLVRHGLVALGFVLIALTPLVGPIPGPGGIIVFGAGLSLILKYTGWAKRLYVRFKRRHPNKGRWADWSLRRASARRREALHRAFAAGSVVEAGREQASRYEGDNAGQPLHQPAAPVGHDQMRAAPQPATTPAASQPGHPRTGEDH
jgi:hypothetical protein